MNEQLRGQTSKRLGRIAGQVAGVQKMVESDRYCIDVLTQIAAIRSALHAVGVEVLSGHVEHCMGGDGAKDSHLIEELREALSRFSK
ncbi:MAG: metal-sensitive transcriptional regulator [Tepidisphaeraceae bacterium]